VIWDSRGLYYAQKNQLYSEEEIEEKKIFIHIILTHFEPPGSFLTEKDADIQNFS